MECIFCGEALIEGQNESAFRYPAKGVVVCQRCALLAMPAGRIIEADFYEDDPNPEDVDKVKWILFSQKKVNGFCVPR